MNILSITAQKPHSTGSGTYLTELVRSFDRQGHRQAVVCGIYPDDSIDFPEGVACYPVYFGQDIPYPIVGMSDIMPYESTRYRDLTPEMIGLFEDAFIRAIGKAVDELDPDLIICHHLFLLTALVHRHFPDIRTAGISHGTDLRQMVNCDNLRELVRPEVAGISHFFALHEEQKRQIAELFGVSPDRITVIGSGYNDALFNTAGRHSREELALISEGSEVPVMICYAGKMSRPKGVPELLRVLSDLADDSTMPPFEVTLAGGCQDDTVREILDHLPDNIRWAGQIPQNRLADIFRFSDIFVLPSYFEGLPLVLIEAMASGMIPISTDLPGVRPWIEKNVPNHNICFIPMPEMAGIDCPTDKGKEQFTDDLHTALRDIIIRVADGSLPDHLPDTSRITWDGVASGLLSTDF